ncbi:MAG: hypothetical protein PV344_05790 [Anaplasma sp.]|nr:hypothetical protein [Anaplasma sp.]
MTPVSVSFPRWRPPRGPAAALALLERESVCFLPRVSFPVCLLPGGVSRGAH